MAMGFRGQKCFASTTAVHDACKSARGYATHFLLWQHTIQSQPLMILISIRLACSACRSRDRSVDVINFVRNVKYNFGGNECARINQTNLGRGISINGWCTNVDRCPAPSLHFHGIHFALLFVAVRIFRLQQMTCDQIQSRQGQGWKTSLANWFRVVKKINGNARGTIWFSVLVFPRCACDHRMVSLNRIRSIRFALCRLVWRASVGLPAHNLSWLRKGHTMASKLLPNTEHISSFSFRSMQEKRREKKNNCFVSLRVWNWRHLHNAHSSPLQSLLRFVNECDGNSNRRQLSSQTAHCTHTKTKKEHHQKRCAIVRWLDFEHNIFIERHDAIVRRYCVCDACA